MVMQNRTHIFDLYLSSLNIAYIEGIEGNLFCEEYESY